MSNAQTQLGNVPVVIAGALVSNVGTLLNQDGGFSALANPNPGEYAFTTVQPYDPARLSVNVAPYGTGNDIGWDIQASGGTSISVFTTVAGVPTNVVFNVLMLRW